MRQKNQFSYQSLESRQLLAADFLVGTASNDLLFADVCEQIVFGGEGNDTLVSYGEYEPSDDLFIGGNGSDVFVFNPLINASFEAQEQNLQNDGSVNWQRLTENNEYSQIGIGSDTILDFESGTDVIAINGLNLQVTFSENGDGYSVIDIYNGFGQSMGNITVFGEIAEGDINVSTGFDAVDVLTGYVGPELDAAIEVRADVGSQTGIGGNNADTFVSLGDDGEPDPAQGGDRINPVNNNPSNDEFFGGYGADTFQFVPLINATAEVIADNTNEAGEIDWQSVAGNNDNVHDHWVEGIGADIIHDFESGRDSILVTGHTATATIEHVDSDGDGVNDYSLLTLTSNQGANGGAHDGDALGTITIYGDLVQEDDVTTDAGVFYGMDELAGWTPPEVENNEQQEQLQALIAQLQQLLQVIQQLLATYA